MKHINLLDQLNTLLQQAYSKCSRNNGSHFCHITLSISINLVSIIVGFGQMHWTYYIIFSSLSFLYTGLEINQ